MTDVYLMSRVEADKEIRIQLNRALDHIMHLENGCALIVCSVTDPDQRKELLDAKRAILRGLAVAR